MGYERIDIYLFFCQKLQKGFHVASFRPTHVADGVVAAFLLIRSVVAAGSVGAGDAEVEFFFVISPALNVDANGAHGYDDGALAGDVTCEVHRLTAGRFRSDENGVDAKALRLTGTKAAKF